MIEVSKIESVELDSKGIAEFLKTSDELAKAVASLAEKIGESAQEKTGEEVAVEHYTTDRRASAITIKSSKGKELVAREGVLIRDAAALGLEVKERKS